MKNRKRIVSIVIISIMLAVSYFLLFFNHDTINRTEKTIETIKEQKESSTKDKNRKRIKLTQKKSDELRQKSKEIRQKKIELIGKNIMAMKVPIEFYGKVIDQNNLPVSDAKIKISIGSYDGTVTRELRSDDKGFFELVGEKGKYLHIDKIEYDGYEQSRSKLTFNYGAQHVSKHIPDYSNPTVFGMWKKGEAEPVIKSNLSRKLVANEGVSYIDLINNKCSEKKIENADLIIELKAEDQVVSERYNWSIALKVVGGGLIETKDTFLYKAPENGYQEIIELKFDKNERNWESIIERKFYLKSRNGKLYASLKCTIFSYNNKRGRISIDSIVNPNGSTNLQYDPAKRILK